MRTITLFLFAALVVTSVDAASYQKTNGTIVNPILDNYGNVLAYSGNNLEPSAQLTFTNLSGANLTGANLSGLILTDTKYYTDATWTDAFYYTDNEPTWRSGMTPSWRTSEGILALSVPEPATLLLALFGLALLPRRRRR